MPNEEDDTYSISAASAGTVSAGTASAGTLSAGEISSGAVAAGSFALGALAVGAFALGAAAVGALVIGRLVVGKARIKTLEIDELTVRSLTLGPGIKTDAAPIDYKAAVKELLTQFSQHSDRIERTEAETAQLRAETRVILTELEALMSAPKATANRTEDFPEQKNTV